jgi:hypothetical protein
VKDKLPLVARCCDGSCTVDELEDLYSHDRQITYKTFAKYVDIKWLADYLGYVVGRWAKGVRLSRDWHLRFYRSKFRGQVCYHLVWSEIDHIFQRLTK